MEQRSSGIVVAAIFGLLVIALAFTIPSAQTDATSADGDVAGEVVRAGDGAGIPDPRSGVSEPEPRPGFEATALKPGEKPPQFVVISIDGGCETRSGVITDFLDLGSEIDGRFTLFMSGLCIIPAEEQLQYRPPGKKRGQSDIGFGDANMISKRLEVLARSYRDGHEIGTHFLGHFCGPSGVDTWSQSQWRSEIQQAKKFLDGWPQFNPNVSAERLPFDSSVFQGARTPCLEGQRDQLLPALAAEGLRYDASDPGTLKWPTRSKGSDLWQFPLPALRLRDTNLWVLAMDYNFMANQNNSKTKADKATCDRIRKQTQDTYMDALEAARDGSRAPLLLGSHLNDWVCNAYADSLHDFARAAKAKYPDVQFISFEDLADWLEVQDPAVLKELQARPAERDY